MYVYIYMYIYTEPAGNGRVLQTRVNHECACIHFSMHVYIVACMYI